MRRIHWRRAHIDDPHQVELGEAVHDVLDFLLRRSSGVPRWVAQADVADALVLSTWLWWQDRRRELQLLRRGRHLGLTLTQLGSPLGIGDQGVTDRIDRLAALLAYDRPDEQLTRAVRRAARVADPERAWIDRHQAQLVRVVDSLLNQVERVGRPTAGADAGGGWGRPEAWPAGSEAGEWLEELRRDLVDEHVTPGTVAVLGLAVAALRAERVVIELNTRHGLHRALREADRQRQSFATLASPA